MKVTVFVEQNNVKRLPTDTVFAVYMCSKLLDRFDVPALIFAVMMTMNGSIIAWISDLFSSIRSGCFGCGTKPSSIIAVDKAAKGLRIQVQTERKTTISNGLWSSSTCDLDNGTIQSQRNIPGVTTLNQFLYHSSETSTESTDPEFVNQGKFRLAFVFLPSLLLWNESRLQWIGNGRSRKQKPQKQEHRLNQNATYESLLGTRQPFPKPIPLPNWVWGLTQKLTHKERFPPHYIPMVGLFSSQCGTFLYIPLTSRIRHLKHKVLFRGCFVGLVLSKVDYGSLEV
ncbi:hypothetical protein VNO77_21829 [Canavalia gladiata]|uniref:Gag1-like clamp domain-containing protein n=1 Tax=Canavalia gladiata TaxID=3824 RepID=A0AAN9QAH4_CANGL